MSIRAEISDKNDGSVLVLRNSFPEGRREYEILRPKCPRCYHPTESYGSGDCRTCRRWIALQRAIALGVYIPTEYWDGAPPNDLSDDIFRAKNEEEMVYANLLGVALSHYALRLHSVLLEFDRVIPMPTAKSYNRERIMASIVSQILDIKLLDNVLYKIPGRQMKGLSLSERQENARKTIHAEGGKSLDGETIIVVDDVLTAGCSLDRCSVELQRIGAGKVVGLVAGRTYHPSTN
ncbi:MAG: hypothetical protein R6V83_10610 [Candidatus Thorarchaeota archaeon]